jgi:hypothetical protein
LNAEKLIKLINSPNSISKEETIELETVLEEFPYFQTARVLHLKGLKNQKNFKYNNSLKQVAAYTTDRTVLFDFITNDVSSSASSLENNNKSLNEIEVIDSEIVNETQKVIATPDNDLGILNEIVQLNKLRMIEIEKDLNKKIEKISKESTTKLPEKKIKNKDDLEIGKPIDFKKDDSFSFHEWLNLTEAKLIVREDDNKKETKSDKNKEKTERKLTLIDAFIKNKPKIKPVKNQVIKDVSESSAVENTNLMTETLARVYLEQKKFKKAITAFKILSLKYPEKSSFFADRIKAIEFLDKNKEL